MGSNFLVPFNIKAAEKNIKWERERGIGNLGKKIKIKKMGWERKLSCRQQYTPLTTKLVKSWGISPGYNFTEFLPSNPL